MKLLMEWRSFVGAGMALVVFSAWLTLPAAGQDAPAASSAGEQEQKSETAPAEPAAVDKSLPDLLTEWSELDKRLREAETAARADGANEETKAAYRDVVDQANQLIDKIQTAALAALSKDAKDQQAINSLLGIMLNASVKTDGDRKALELADALINAGVPIEAFQPAINSKRLTPFGKDLFNEIAIRHKEHQANDLPRIKLHTSKGDIEIELFENEAPNTVANFISLVKAKFYDGLKFHRVIEGFMAQGGDPLGTGSGGPGYNIKCECYAPNARKHFSGSLSMAHAGRDTGGSQFFLTFRATSHLDGRHTVFGRVVSGMDVLDQLNRTSTDVGPIPGVEPDKIETAEVVRDRGHEYKPVKVGESAAAGSDPPK